MLKALIYFTGLLIVLGGLSVGYHLGFVSPQAVPFAFQLFFIQGYYPFRELAPFACFVFFALIGNGLACLFVYVAGQVFGYKIQVESFGNVPLGLSLQDLTDINGD